MLKKIIIFLSFLAGLCLVFYGFFLTATVKGLLLMLLGLVLLVVSLFLYNLNA